MIGHARPVFRFAEKLPNGPEAQTAERPPEEDLLIRLRRAVERGPDACGIVPVRELLLQTRGGSGECFHFPVIQQLDAAHALLLGIEAVLRDLAEPDADIAGPAEAGQGAHSAAECFARQLFGKLGIVRKGKQIAVDIIKINAVDLRKL